MKVSEDLQQDIRLIITYERDFDSAGFPEGTPVCSAFGSTSLAVVMSHLFM